jgi:hypothetical protein
MLLSTCSSFSIPPGHGAIDNWKKLMKLIALFVFDLGIGHMQGRKSQIRADPYVLGAGRGELMSERLGGRSWLKHALTYSSSRLVMKSLRLWETDHEHLPIF